MTEPEADSDSPAKAPPDAEVGASTAPDGASASSEAEASDEPKKKRRKKKRARATDTLRDERDAQGRNRPAFLLDFPQHPDLEPLIRAFELGNYALVREDAPRLVERADDAEVKAAASELLRRIEPDPLVKFMLAVAVALFCAVVGYVYLSH